MRTYTTEHTVYKLEELDAAAQGVALEAFRDINVDYEGWHDHQLEHNTAGIEAQGLRDVKIQYTGFWSQGDGASFTGEINELHKFMKHHKLAGKWRTLYTHAADIDAGIRKNGSWSHYEHENTIEGYAECYSITALEMKTGERLENQLEQFEEWLTLWARSTSQRIYEGLRKDYEELTSDEAIREAIDAGEYEFYKDGRPA